MNGITAHLSVVTLLMVTCTASAQESLSIKSAQVLDTTEPCFTDARIVASAEGYRASGKVEVRNGRPAFWCPGALHTWQGISVNVRKGFIQRIESNETSPLAMYVSQGTHYVYRSGEGIITLDDGSTVRFPRHQSQMSPQKPQSPGQVVEPDEIVLEDSPEAPTASQVLPPNQTAEPEAASSPASYSHSQQPTTLPQIQAPSEAATSRTSTSDDRSPADESWIARDDPREEDHNSTVRRRKLRGRLNWDLRLEYASALSGVSVSETKTTQSSGPRSTSVSTKSYQYDVDLPSRIWMSVGVGRRIIPELSLSGYAMGGIETSGESRFGASFGGRVLLFPTPAAQDGGWLGIGLGYQWLWFDEGAFRGLEVVPQAGFDFALGQDYLIGPSFELPIAKYSTSKCPDCEIDGGTWGVLGLRLSRR